MADRNPMMPGYDEIHILWTSEGMSCDGDSVSVTAARLPSIEGVVLGAIPNLPKVHLHNKVLAYETGDEFQAPFWAASRGELEPFIFVVEGSFPNEQINGDDAGRARRTAALSSTLRPGGAKRGSRRSRARSSEQQPGAMMRITRNQVIGGLPAFAARALMRELVGSSLWDLDQLHGRAEMVGAEDPEVAISALIAEGYLAENPKDPGRYGPTDLGDRLYRASGTIYRRATADRALAELIARAEEINHNPDLMYWVNQLIVSGSCLNPEIDPLGDPWPTPPRPIDCWRTARPTRRLYSKRSERTGDWSDVTADGYERLTRITAPGAGRSGPSNHD